MSCGTMLGTVQEFTHSGYLRIDNSGHSVICAFDHSRKSLLVTITYDIPNKREYFSLSYDRSAVLN